MIKFLLKGLLRDRSRSLFPILIVTIGVALTVFVHAWMAGYLDELIQTNARFNTGHVKITTRAQAEQSGQISNELALMGVDSLILELNKNFSDLYWTPRIHFGGLLDIPDENGETKKQGPVAGMAVDLLNPGSIEKENLNLSRAVVSGRLIENSKELLISDDFARRLGVQPGDAATLISSTMYGGMALENFKIVGTVQFGVTALDRGAVIADVRDIQQALYMEDAATEILGFFKDGKYEKERANQVAEKFNSSQQNTNDEFAPVMISLHNQNGLAEMLGMMSRVSFIAVMIFIVAMSIVLWNAGLMGSLRRYGEIGVRLAIGERKGHLYRTLIAESLLIGIFGSIFGTILGLVAAYYLQKNGIDYSSLMKGSSMLISNVLRAKITPTTYFIGFIPGLVATFIGSAIAGIGIYRRETAQLFKELEV
ncbi:MAG: ABC transporter permease [Calditrichaeota bacterium]|nr:ABC transporter permease [Calditrichota bacterium]